MNLYYLYCIISNGRQTDRKRELGERGRDQRKKRHEKGGMSEISKILVMQQTRTPHAIDSLLSPIVYLNLFFSLYFAIAIV